MSAHTYQANSFLLLFLIFFMDTLRRDIPDVRKTSLKLQYKVTLFVSMRHRAFVSFLINTLL